MIGFKNIDQTDFSKQVVYDYLNDKFQHFCQVETHDFIEKTYKIEGFTLKVFYGSLDLLDFFHPSIAFIETKKDGEKADLSLYVAERRDLDFYDCMNQMEDSYFEKEGIAYQIGNIDNNEVRKKVYREYHSIKYIDNQRNTGFYLINKLELIPNWERSFSFRDLLNWHFTKTPFQLLHGAGLAYKGKGVLLTAKGGSGKSTTTIQSILQGLQTVGDDFTLVNIETKMMFCLYNIAKLRRDTYKQLEQAYFPESAVTFYVHNQKFHLDLMQLFESTLLKKIAIDYLLIPVISNQSEAHFEKVSLMEAFNALLPNTLLLLDGNRGLMIKKIQSFLKDIPCYRFHLSKDFEKNPVALKQFLDPSK